HTCTHTHPHTHTPTNTHTHTRTQGDESKESHGNEFMVVKSDLGEYVAMLGQRKEQYLASVYTCIWWSIQPYWRREKQYLGEYVLIFRKGMQQSLGNVVISIWGECVTVLQESVCVCIR